MLKDAEFHSRRLKNLSQTYKIIRKSKRFHSISEYYAGQVTYNMGEYPEPFSLAPTGYDEQLLEKFAWHGVELIQIAEEWNDSQRCLGANKLTSHDPEGLQKFVDLVHSLGMKIILYASTGFFQATDPDFNPEWAHDNHLKELYFDYARCSPASPSWRAYILPKLEHIMDTYGVDGLFDDLGYVPLYKQKGLYPSNISPAPETPEHDAALEDMLEMVMGLVHRRRGILKIHYGSTDAPLSSRKLYDYLWVGESIGELDTLRQKTRYLEPYVVPCPDMSRAKIEKEDDFYLHTIPYMQFPLRVDGRPCTGKRSLVEGINYRRVEDCFWTRHLRNVWRYYQEHSSAPPMYGLWDSCPGRIDGRSRWLYYLSLYLPMVQKDTRVWIDIGDSLLVESDKTDNLTASLFVNDKMYFVLANYGYTDIQVKSCWKWQDRESDFVGSILTVPARKLLLLQQFDR